MRKSALPLLLLSIILPGAATVVYTTVSQDSLTLGERLELSVSLVTPPGAKITAPDPEQRIGKLVVKSWDEQRVAREKSDSLCFKYLLTTYTVEPCTIPRLPFVQIKPDRMDTLWSDSILIRVVSVINAKPGDTVVLKDLKPQQRAGKPSLLLWWILIGVIIVAIAAYLMRTLWKKRQLTPLPPPPEPPYEEAIRALKKLEEKQYLTKGLIREFVFELSGILRRYLGRRFGSNAEDFTTEEIIDWINKAPLTASVKHSLEWFFNETHPVKFAKMIPDISTITQFLEETKLVVEKTKPLPESSSPEVPAEGQRDMA